jgi:hypothetical protein
LVKGNGAYRREKSMKKMDDLDGEDELALNVSFNGD